MLFLMIVIIFCNIAYVSNKNAGTTIFNSRQIKSDCWSQDDIAKLIARKTFEDLIPPEVSPDIIDTRYTKQILKYFKSALKNVESDVDCKTAVILKEALSDTIGAHLKSEILPTIRFAFYAGYVPYRNVKQLHDFYEHLKENLNTQGLGWRQPTRLPQWANLTVAKIQIGSGRLLDPCTYLVTKRDANDCIHFPAPKLDDDLKPEAISLPFKSQAIVSLTARNSDSILLKYYTTASRCILHSSPASCRHADFVNLNNELWHWMKRDVAPHLVDDKLYTAYGGVLRIAAAVQNYGKGLSRRNLFDAEDTSISKWNPWTALSQSYIVLNADWSPKVYICLVLLVAVIICLMQVCYNYLIGDANGCRCKGKSQKSSLQAVAYTSVDSNFPAVLPHQSAIYYSEKKRVRQHPPSRSKTSSLGSIRTHKVYDLNENTEKLMAVIMSDNEETDEGSSPSKIDTEEEYSDKRLAIADVAKDVGPPSPPQIETSVAQLTIEKMQPLEKKTSVPMYSTSTLTRSDVTYCPDKMVSDTCWSGSSSCTSGKTLSSTSSKSRSCRSRSSRDLAWTRHVISRQSRRGTVTKSTITGPNDTELDANSFTTPPSRR